MQNDRNIEFLFEIGTLKNVNRTWEQVFGIKCATNLEHSFRVAFLALLIGRMEGGANEEKLLKMALVHDLPETRTGDKNYTQKMYNQEHEARAASDQFMGTIFTDLHDEILHEYSARQSKESRIVKDADNLEVDMELKEFAERGSQLPEKWKSLRRMVRDEKLYTESAKKLWDELQTADPASWHLSANKWKHMPEAGK